MTGWVLKVAEHAVAQGEVRWNWGFSLRPSMGPPVCTDSASQAEDGKDALEVLQSESPDLMLVDIQMPHLDGLQLLNTIRQDDRFTSVPVVAITAYAMAGDDAWALEEGFDRYLSKPISVRRLRATVDELLQSDGDGRTDSVS